MRKKKYIRKLEKLLERVLEDNHILADALERSRENYPEQFEKRADLN